MKVPTEIRKNMKLLTTFISPEIWECSCSISILKLLATHFRYCFCSYTNSLPLAFHVISAQYRSSSWSSNCLMPLKFMATWQKQDESIPAATNQNDGSSGHICWYFFKRSLHPLRRLSIPQDLFTLVFHCRYDQYFLSMKPTEKTSRWTFDFFFMF